MHTLMGLVTLVLGWRLLAEPAPPEPRPSTEMEFERPSTLADSGLRPFGPGIRAGTTGTSGSAPPSRVVVTADDPGTPAEAHPPFWLPFRAVDVVLEPNAPFAWLADTNTPRILRVDLRTGLADRQFPLDKWPHRLALAPDGATLFAALSPSARLLRTGFVAEFHLPTAVRRREVPVDTGINQMLPGPGDLLIGGIDRGEMLVYRLGEPRRLDARASMVFKFARSPSPTNFYLFGLVGGVSRWGVNPDTGALTPEGSFSNTGPVGDDLFVLPDGTTALSGVGRLLACDPLAPVSQDLRTLQTLHTGRVEAVVFDLPRRALFLLGAATQSPPYRTNLYHYHIDSHLFLGSYPVTNGTRFLGVDADFVYAAAVRTNGTFFQRLANPAGGGNTNHPPIARFEVDPVEATTREAVSFDASGSSDEDDGTQGLAYRWDWDGDANFDTEFEGQPTGRHRFNLAGAQRVVLEVRDRQGAAGRSTREVFVTAVEDPGEVPVVANPPFVLPFVPNALVFDPVRPRLFAADSVGKRLVGMNLDTGLVEREYALDHHPDALGVSADGQRLAVTTLHRTGYTTPASPWKGFLAHFDLERDVKVREFGLSFIPRSIALSARGFAILGGHGSATAASGVHVLRLSTGDEVHTGPPYATTRSTVHPDQSRFYAVTMNSSQATAYRFEILEDGTVTNRGGFGGEYMSDWIEMLDANRLVSGRGGVFESSSDPTRDGRLLATLDANIYDLASDPVDRAFFVVGATWSGQPCLRLLNASTLAVGRELAVPPGTRHVHATPDLLYWVSVDAGSATLGRMANPAIGGETNQPPVARFDFSPGEPVAGQAVRFDAGSTTDDGPDGDLRYRWDWEANGAFDTPFSRESTLSRSFEFGGSRTVVLQVLDAYGRTNLAARTLNVAMAPREGTTDFELTFAVSGFQFHPTRPVAYAVDPLGQRVVEVALDSGFVAREARLTHPANSLALSPDGTKLVVALRRRISIDGEGEGTFVDFDPETLAPRGEFEVAMDPEDVVVSDAGVVVAASGSGQWTAVRTFRLATGDELGSAPAFYHGRLAMHPSQRAFYLSTTAQNPPGFTRFDLDPASGAITVRGTSGEAAGDVFPGPGGDEIVSASGALLRASDEPDQDLQPLRRIVEAHFTDVSFEAVSGLAFGVGAFWADSSATRLFVLGSNYEVLEDVPMPAATRLVQAAAPRLYTVEIEADRTLIRRRRHPLASVRLEARAIPGIPGAVEIEVRGSPGREVVLIRSPDLTSWIPVWTNRFESESLIHRSEADEASGYFRAVLGD